MAHVMIPLVGRGWRIGEMHHNSTISDAKVELMRDRREYDHWTYAHIAAEFGIALTTVRKICTYERRASTPDRWKRVQV